jgi:FtsZ-binding cell division protein ZapB
MRKLKIVVPQSFLLKLFAPQSFLLKLFGSKSLSVLLLMCLCVNSWAAENRISILQKEISTLEDQKGRLEAKKQKLMDEGDKLSREIEELKMQPRGGLGIIGRYKLTRKLRKAQALSEKIQILERDIYDVESGIDSKKKSLEREYDRQIDILLKKLNEASKTEESREILERLRQYQSAKKQLAKQDEEEPAEYLDVSKIEIEEFDGPQEIREKADLLNDVAGKMDNGVETLSARIGRLKGELETRAKLGEFAEEISFFGERVSKEEVVAAARGEPAKTVDEKPDDVPATLEASEPNKDADVVDTIAIPRQPITQPPTEETARVTEVGASEPSGKMVLERNGIYADFTGTSLEQIEMLIKLMEEQKKELEKELIAVSQKAKLFYKKADEIEKSETKASGDKR